MDCADAREQLFEEDGMTLASIEVEAGVEDTFVAVNAVTGAVDE
jgi:hypothetical protein